MNRGMLLKHLRLAEKHVAQGERHIARQREIIAELARDSHSTASAESLLELFESTQAGHLAHLDRLRQELAENSN